MKVGDLVQHKRRGCLGVVLEIRNKNKSADVVWTPPRIHYRDFDNVSMSRLKVISEKR